jgi:hypothetical protein
MKETHHVCYLRMYIYICTCVYMYDVCKQCMYVVCTCVCMYVAMYLCCIMQVYINISTYICR